MTPDNGNMTQRSLLLDDPDSKTKSPLLSVLYARSEDTGVFDRDSLFGGFTSMRALTYSASIPMIMGLLRDYDYERFECIFGHGGILGREPRQIIHFQQQIDERLSRGFVAIAGVSPGRREILHDRVADGRARFFVVKDAIAHAKIYLLERDGMRRIVVGSANLSERAFSGKQPETLVVFDDDEEAWDHYNRMFDTIRNEASDEIPLPKEKITTAEIEVLDTPVMSDISGTLVIEAGLPEESHFIAPVQIERIERVAAVFDPRISAAVPPLRNGRQVITPEVKKEITRVRLVKSVEDAESRYFSFDRVNRTANLSGGKFELEWNEELVVSDAKLMLNYFGNYEGNFEGNVSALQRDYFTLMCWLYFSPFICDVRSLALLQDDDVIRCPSFAIVFGKSGCGKTSLIDTLTTSMFGFTPLVDKGSFTRAQLRGLQHAYRRLPVVFDDISKRAFSNYGVDMIKNESHPEVSEYPGFVLSMNSNEQQSFPDEVVRRSLLIYTTTAFPPYNEALRQRLHSQVTEIRRGLTGHLYRRYLSETSDKLDTERFPDDWLRLSSEVLSGILSQSVKDIPEWCSPVSWVDFAEKRYDRIKVRLRNLLRKDAFIDKKNSGSDGWTIDGDSVIVWESRDAFGRSGFSWEDVPSTLIDLDASGPGRTVLHRSNVEEFTNTPVRVPGGWWKRTFRQ